jgi:hypothetical protein
MAPRQEQQLETTTRLPLSELLWWPVAMVVWVTTGWMLRAATPLRLLGRSLTEAHCCGGPLAVSMGVPTA